MDSRATVTLEFAVGTDMAESLLKVNTRLQQVREYPEDAREPVITTSGSSDQPDRVDHAAPARPRRRRAAGLAGRAPRDRRRRGSRALRAQTSGLRERRLETAAEKHPEVKPLLPPDVDVAEASALRGGHDRVAPRARLRRLERQRVRRSRGGAADRGRSAAPRGPEDHHPAAAAGARRAQPRRLRRRLLGGQAPLRRAHARPVPLAGGRRRGRGRPPRRRAGVRPRRRRGAARLQEARGRGLQLRAPVHRRSTRSARPAPTCSR